MVCEKSSEAKEKSSAEVPQRRDEIFFLWKKILVGEKEIARQNIIQAQKKKHTERKRKKSSYS